MRTVEELAGVFRQQGRRVTPQRRRIFDALAGAREHPTAEAVYRAVSADMPTISLRTVYQTLNELAAMGEVAALDLGTGATRFDPNLAPHHHLVCDGCGRIEDLHVAFDDVGVPDEVALRFSVEGVEITFRGRCAECGDPADPTITTPTTGGATHDG